MEQVRFEKFTLLIDGIHKSIHNLKITIGPHLGVKGVHVLWVWELLKNPDGLTAAELAMRSMVNRSLVSREIEALREGGYVVLSLDGGNKYNGKLRLTDKGRELAENIGGEVVRIQDAVDEGISEVELDAFYKTLEKLNDNFKKYNAENKEKNYGKQG